jgi:threonine/homoserine/homoserine lactone efflux protein
LILYLLQGIILALTATIMPGPFQAFLLSYALKHGWKRTLPAALAPLFTDGPILALFLFLLTHMPQWCLDTLRIAGGLFILYLARGVFLAFREAAPRPEPDERAARKGLLNAIVINGLNPNPYIFWSMVGGPIVLSGWRESASLGITFLAAFFGTFVCSLAALIVVFGTAGRIDPRLSRILGVIAFAALLAFGLYQIVVGVTGLIMSG